MEKKLIGKVALVTGGAQGIGKAVAMRLASEGADIAVVDVDETKAAAAVKEIEEKGGRALSFGIDLSDIPSIKPMIGHVVDHFKHIDILVSAAGVVQYKKMLELTEEEWDWILDINLKGMTFCMQAVGIQMTKQARETGRPGKIVNISSISGRRGRSLHIHYAASKAAVISITQSAALALAPYKINVNAVCPGIVPTRMWDHLEREKAQIDGSEEGQAMSSFVERIPLKRTGSPEEIAGVVAFFCSTDADYITGQTLNVDGGFEMS